MQGVRPGGCSLMVSKDLSSEHPAQGYAYPSCILRYEEDGPNLSLLPIFDG